MTERLLGIDLARSLALAGMVIFHFSYDLEIFGWLAQGTVVSGFFWYFARIVAGSFIFLSGMGLWFSHGAGIRWGAFWRRLAKIGAAAVLVSLVTHFALPGLTIFYGILHSIAVSSLLGLAFLRLPVAAILALAAFVFTLPWIWSDPAFGGWLIWTGLSGIRPMTADFEPLFPWFAPFLAGIALAKWLDLRAVRGWLQLRSTPAREVLAWPGRHSLAIYLIHQPVLFGLIWAFTWIWWRI